MYRSLRIGDGIPEEPGVSRILDRNGPFAAGSHMVHAGGQAAHWDIQNKAT